MKHGQVERRICLEDKAALLRTVNEILIRAVV